MFAEMRRVDETRDADGVQLLPRTDPGQRQELQRADHSGAQDHLLGGVSGHRLAGGGAVLDARGAPLPGRACQDHALRALR